MWLYDTIDVCRDTTMDNKGEVEGVPLWSRFFLLCMLFEIEFLGLEVLKFLQ